MVPFPLRPEDHDRFDGAVGGAEPVRRPGRELDGLARLDREVIQAEDQPQLAAEDVDPVVSLVYVQLGHVRRGAALRADGDFEGMEAAGGGASGERPHRHSVISAWLGAHARVLAGRRGEQLVGADAERVGGGAAGLSAALVLGRARRKTLVIDAGNPSNAVAHGIGGLLGSDTRPPADFYAAGRAELVAYPTVELRAGEVVAGERKETSFALRLADGSSAYARRVLLATGMEYRLPELPGIAERWGRSVFHCPFCHGWENRDKALGVFRRGGALLLRAWGDDVTLL